MIEGVTYRPAYFSGMRQISERSLHRFEVTKEDVPNFGLTSVIVIEPNEDGKRKKSGRLIMFSPFALTAHQVHEECGELAVGKIHDKREYPLTQDRIDMLSACITKAWRMYCRLGMVRDYATAADVLRRFGKPVPEDRPVVAVTTNSSGEPKKHGKLPNEELVKPVTKDSKRGQILIFFQEGGKTVMEAMGVFGMTRSGVLTHLHGLWRDHGIGYLLQADVVTIELPPDCEDPFVGEDKTPPKEKPAKEEKPKSKAAPKNKAEEEPIVDKDEGTVYEATRKKRRGPQKNSLPPRAERDEQGKTKPGPSTPLPDKGKRREVAIGCLNWIEKDKLAAKVGCSLASLASHLHDLKIKHGLGYESSSDKKKVRLVVPKGWTP